MHNNQKQFYIRTDYSRNIVTGGGTAGHVTPNIALLPGLKELDYDIHYIGSYDGIESKLIEDYKIPYYGISTGKFRRYFDPKNFSDPFRVIKENRINPMRIFCCLLLILHGWESRSKPLFLPADIVRFRENYSIFFQQRGDKAYWQVPSSLNM